MLSFSCTAVVSNRYSTATILKHVANYTTVVALDQDDEWISARPFHEIPGPKPLPLIGNTWRFLPYIGEYHNLYPNALFKKYREQYGDIVKVSDRPGIINGVHLFNPDDIEKVLRREGKWPIRDFTPSFTYYRMVTRKDLFQGIGGVLATQGEEWQKLRTKVNPAMMQPRNTNLYVRQIDEVAQEFVQKMRRLKGKNEELPEYFNNELCKWALESIALVALDKRMGCLADNLPEDSEQQKLVNAAVEVIELFYQLEVEISYWRYFSTPAWKKFVKVLDCFNEVAWKYIQEAMHKIKTRSLQTGDLSILERILLNETDPKIAFVNALDMLFGGIDTTANSAAILLYYLAKNPEKQEKLYDELKRILPSTGEDITVEKLEDMKFLRACLKESMRLSPIAFGNSRRIPKDMVLSNYQVPAGTNVLMMHGHLCLDEKYFPQAHKFQPERWMKGPNGEPSESKQAHPFVYMPFGFGPRMCLGRRFAELEIHTFVARTIRNFNVDYNYEMKFKQEPILKPVSPLKFKITDRA